MLIFYKIHFYVFQRKVFRCYRGYLEGQKGDWAVTEEQRRFQHFPLSSLQPNGSIQGLSICILLEHKHSCQEPALRQGLVFQIKYKWLPASY